MSSLDYFPVVLFYAYAGIAQHISAEFTRGQAEVSPIFLASILQKQLN